MASFTQGLSGLKSTAMIQFEPGGLGTASHSSGHITEGLQLGWLEIALLGHFPATDLITHVIHFFFLKFHPLWAFLLPPPGSRSFIYRCETWAGVGDVHYQSRLQLKWPYAGLLAVTHTNWKSGYVATVQSQWHMEFSMASYPKWYLNFQPSSRDCRPHLILLLSFLICNQHLI